MHTLQVLEKKLGYTFRCKEQLQAALYHSSYANEHRCCGVSSNERLEFLGDAVLGLVTADYLYHKHPDLPEGDLTRMRAALVCEESLYEVAQSLGLGNELRLGKGEEAGGGRCRPPSWPTPRSPCSRRCIWTAAWRPPGADPPGPAGQGAGGGRGGAPPGL